MIDAIAATDKDKTVENQTVNAMSASGVIQSIKAAADRTGVDFTYLMKKATQESSLDPTAKASTSSAMGLYQFTSQTWLRSIKQHGADYGLGSYAEHIKIDSNGIAHVDSTAMKHTILKLRSDPTISAEMSAELDKDNLATLKGNVTGKLGATELYLAHFLGAGGASDFLNTMKATPNAKAADILPQAATANNSVFYDKNGEARSLKQIYAHFAQKFDTNKSASTLVASTTPVKPTTAYDIAGLSKITPTHMAPAFTLADNSIGASSGYTNSGYVAPSAYTSAASAYSGIATSGHGLGQPAAIIINPINTTTAPQKLKLRVQP